MCENKKNIVSLCIMNSNQYKDSLMLLEIYVVAIGLHMSNNEIFIETTIIHSLQGFYIHYGMYVVARRLEIFFVILFIILWDFLEHQGG